MEVNMNDGILLLGRILIASLFLPSGIGKLFDFAPFAASLAAKGMPFPEAFASVAVLIEVLGPIALILGAFPRSTAWVMIAFVIMATATSHRFWEFDAEARRMQQINFFKNVGIIAGFLFYSVSGAGSWSWIVWPRTSRPETA
jgi:putative oxidoreductase